MRRCETKIFLIKVLGNGLPQVTWLTSPSFFSDYYCFVCFPKYEDFRQGLKSSIRLLKFHAKYAHLNVIDYSYCVIEGSGVMSAGKHCSPLGKMAKIKNYLYLGGLAAAKMEDLLKENGITCVISGRNGPNTNLFELNTGFISWGCCTLRWIWPTT